MEGCAFVGSIAAFSRKPDSDSLILYKVGERQQGGIVETGMII